MKKTVYAPRALKRARRTQASIAAIEDAVVGLLDDERPMTCRQCFYRLVSLGLIAKSEQQYKGTVVRLLGRLRRERRIPFHWIADNTRWMRKPNTYTGLESAVNHCAAAYRRDLWDQQPTYVEVWCEKDALAGVIVDVTDPYDVPLMVSRGFASTSYIYAAAKNIAAKGKPAHIYYFGDHDPSGVAIDRAIEKGLREFAPDAEIHFHRRAVTADLIESMRLPTRPTKKTDSRSKTFIGESVDLDAIPPNDLRKLVEDCITEHIDADQLRRTKAIEAEERKALAVFAATATEGRQ